METFRIISEDQIRLLIDMPQAIKLMKDAFVAISSGLASVPLRSSIDIPSHDARALFMPVYVPLLHTIAIKVVSVFPNNTQLNNIPNIHGKLLLINADNGISLCIMDAEYITALRTGAASGLATDLLSDKNSSVLAIFGTGVQAYTQVQGICAIRKIKKLLLFGEIDEQIKSFSQKIKDVYNGEIIFARPKDLIQADIICTATNSIRPVFFHHNVKPGCHINAIGAFKPDMQEIPEETVAGSYLIVDQMEAALAEAGDIATPISKGVITSTHIKAELGELLAGNFKSNKKANVISLFKSVGNAVQDIYVAKYVYDKYTFNAT